MPYSSESTTDDVLDGIRLDGKHALVTGATGGLGIETGRALASVGAAVTIAGRSADKLEAALSTLRQQVPGGSFDAEQIDLASLTNVRAGVKRIVDRGRSIDLLINNAGVMLCPEGQTEDGFETQFGTNHLGHFVLTAGLLPALSPGARVVVLSSAAHLSGSCDLDDLNWRHRAYDPSLAYAQSKTANIWFASELQRRYSDRLTAFSVHPGVIQTDLGRHLTEAMIDGMRARFEEGGITLKSVPQGAATSVWAATAPELADRGGAYLLDCHVSEAATPDNPAGFAPWAYDPAAEARLWEESEKLTGVTFR